MLFGATNSGFFLKKYTLIYSNENIFFWNQILSPYAIWKPESYAYVEYEWSSKAFFASDTNLCKWKNSSYPIWLAYGGFQLLDLIITELKSHMTS